MTKELEIIDLKVGEGKEAVKGALITDSLYWLARRWAPSLTHHWIVVTILKP